MEFGFSEEQKRLMAEIREFCMNELPEDYDPDYVGGPPDVETHEFWKRFHQKGVEKGWPTAGWPKKYGGMGFTAMEQAAVASEMAYWGARWAGIMSLPLVGPTVLAAGTEEQKQKWIPQITRGEITCLEAFTEPEAGSDEANVQLRAVPDGDDFILNGQKTFISGNEKPDWLYTLCKTADVTPKHRGLSIFMVPADAPGVTFRPLPTMGGSMQNEIFFDNVRVPKGNMIGELNRGFYLAMTTFEFERAAGGGLGARRSMERIVEFCREEKRNGKPLLKDPKARETLARMAIHHHLAFLFGWYTAWRRSQREKLGPQNYDVGTLYHRLWQLYDGEAMGQVFGLYAQLKPNSKYAKYKGKASRTWEYKHAIHAAGSPEIRRVVIADRGLGLPRIPRQFHTMINEALKKEQGR
jgi:alkylation response protein AidB-like acyl-CoA dehydrogenase